MNKVEENKVPENKPPVEIKSAFAKPKLKKQKGGVKFNE